MAQAGQRALVGQCGPNCDPCVLYNSATGCPYGHHCRFCHHAFELDNGGRPRKDRRAKIKERIGAHFYAENLEDLLEGLQQEARQYPYARDLLKGYLDRVRPKQVAGGLVFSL
eukprot:s293_g6.t1